MSGKGGEGGEKHRGADGNQTGAEAIEEEDRIEKHKEEEKKRREEREW